MQGAAHWTDRGYSISFGDHVLARDAHLAGTDQERAADLMAAFQDPTVDAVYCSRGGYGCARLMPYLDLDRMASSGKCFIGFSDITTLHIALNNRGLATFYAPMPLTLAFDRQPFVFESIFNMVRGDPVTPAAAPRAKCAVPGIGEGNVVGGCLCLIVDSLGTPEEIQTKGNILAIEDVDEAPHRIDAMFTHLLNCGKLQEAAGVVIGEMTRTDEKHDGGIGGKPWREIVGERLDRAGVPAVMDYPFGHYSNMLTLAFGIKARLDAGAGTLEYLESPCS